MSFVSVVANKEFISVMSDGRAYQYGSNGKMNIIQEDASKIMRIAPNQFIAHTGVVQDALRVTEGYVFREEGWELNKISTGISHMLIGCPRKNSLVIGGRDKGKLVLYYVSTDEHEAKQLISEDDPVEFIIRLYLTSAYIKASTQDVRNKFEEFVQQTRGNILDAQVLLHHYVAENDPTVNTNISKLLVQL